MVVEHAQISVVPGREEEFVAAFPDALAVISRAEGFEWAELHRVVERPSVFLLRVGWRTLEDHTFGFRNSALFADWRGVVGPFFDEPPVVEHVTQVVERFSV